METSSVSAAAAAPPHTVMAPVATSAPGAGQVWVNAKCGVIWKPGSRYQGKTEEGEYLAAGDALQAGYHSASGTGN